MYFDFCVSDTVTFVPTIGVDVIYHICGDKTYQVPNKNITSDKIYFVYTTLGKGQITVDNTVFILEQGDFLFIKPDEFFSYRCIDENWHFWWFEFYMENLPFELGNKYNTIVDDFCMTMFDKSLYYGKRDDFGTAATLFYSILNILQSSSQKTTPTVSEEVVQVANIYIRDHISTVTVTTLSEYLDINQRTLRNIFCKILNQSPKYFINQVKLDLSRQLLENTSLSIEQISNALGFSNQFHFSNSFSDKYGVPPQRYRKFFTSAPVSEEPEPQKKYFIPYV